MESPKKITITIEWTDNRDVIRKMIYTEKDLESDETLIGLMTGNIKESDLEP